MTNCTGMGWSRPYLASMAWVTSSGTPLVLVNGPPGMECIRVKVIRMIMNMAMIMVPMRFRINLTITFSLFRVHGRRTGNGAPTAALWP